MEPSIKPFESRFNAVRQESRDRIRALLTPEQLPKYEEMVENHDKMREQERERSVPRSSNPADRGGGPF